MFAELWTKLDDGKTTGTKPLLESWAEQLTNQAVNSRTAKDLMLTEARVPAFIRDR